MELRNRVGEIAKLADNLTLKEIVDMSCSIDICDENYDSDEHWTTHEDSDKKERGYP